MQHSLRLQHLPLPVTNIKVVLPNQLTNKANRGEHDQGIDGGSSVVTKMHGTGHEMLAVETPLNQAIKVCSSSV
jgi:hypothetical protein